MMKSNVLTQFDFPSKICFILLTADGVWNKKSGNLQSEPVIKNT